MGTRFIDHLNTQLVTTSNYSAIANLHTLQITRAYAKSFPACNVFTGRFLLTASNSADSSVSALTPLPAGYRLTTDSVLQLTNSQAGGHLTPAPSLLFTD
jgi:hypothetical protein